MTKLAMVFIVLTLPLVGDVTGTWSGTAESRFPSGKVETHALTFILKQTGTRLTGSMGPDPQHQLPIDNGTAVNDTVRFDCKWGNGALIHVRLVANGDELRGQADGDASQIPADPGPNYTNTVYLTLKRASTPGR